MTTSSDPAVSTADAAARDAAAARSASAVFVDPGLTLVLAGTGKTGRRVAAGLTQLGVDVRIGARSVEPRFDWTDATTWDAALDGVQAVYLAYSPDLAVPGAVDHVRGFTALAAERGVQRLVLLSGRGEETAEASERLVLDGPIPATVVRASWFAQNFSEDFMADGVTGGVLVLPETSVAEPYIDADDIAAVAVAALTQPGYEGQVLEVTGPELLTMPEVVAQLQAATGRPLTYVPLPLDAYLEGAAEQGVPPELRDLIGYLFSELMDGRNASTTGTIERVLGRPARRFADYARAAAAAGAWAAAPEAVR